MKDIKLYVTECYADMEMVNFLLDIIEDYENVLFKRHHKFVESYFYYNRNIQMVAKAYSFSEKDMLRIFWRIQRRLLLEFIERAGKGLIKVKETPKNFDAFLLWQLEQFRDDAYAVYTYIKDMIIDQIKFNIDGVSKTRKEQIENILKELSKYNNLEEILPKYVYVMAKDLLSGMSLTEVVKKHNKNLDYIVKSIVGRKKWRSKSERGWLGYIEDYQNNLKKSKIVQFPSI